MEQVGKIYEGWRNKLFPPKKIKGLIEQVSRDRMLICNECEYNSKFHKTYRPDEHCMLCGCTLSALTRCLSCECSDKRWGMVLTEEQEDEIMESYESNES